MAIATRIIASADFAISPFAADNALRALEIAARASPASRAVSACAKSSSKDFEKSPNIWEPPWRNCARGCHRGSMSQRRANEHECDSARSRIVWMRLLLLSTCFAIAACPPPVGNEGEGEGEAEECETTTTRPDDVDVAAATAFVEGPAPACSAGNDLEGPLREIANIARCARQRIA